MKIPIIKTRLKPSLLHKGGIGVFAILPIKRGQVIFDTKGANCTYVPATKLTRLPAPVQKMYTDFAMQVNEIFYTPRDFTRMGMFWYICHSNKPNCRFREGSKDNAYVATRNIKAGEEICVNYNLFKDTQVGDVPNCKQQTHLSPVPDTATDLRKKSAIIRDWQKFCALLAKELKCSSIDDTVLARVQTLIRSHKHLTNDAEVALRDAESGDKTRLPVIANTLRHSTEQARNFWK